MHNASRKTEVHQLRQCKYINAFVHKSKVETSWQLTSIKQSNTNISLSENGIKIVIAPCQSNPWIQTCIWILCIELLETKSCSNWSWFCRCPRNPEYLSADSQEYEAHPTFSDWVDTPQGLIDGSARGTSWSGWYVSQRLYLTRPSAFLGQNPPSHSQPTQYFKMR